MLEVPNFLCCQYSPCLHPCATLPVKAHQIAMSSFLALSGQMIALHILKQTGRDTDPCGQVREANHNSVEIASCLGWVLPQRCRALVLQTAEHSTEVLSWHSSNAYLVSPPLLLVVP